MTRRVQCCLAMLCMLMSAGLYGQKLSLAKADWLAGRWENQTQRGKMIEEWTVRNDSVFSAKSYLVTASDTVWLESVELKKEGDEIFYIPTVKGQNNEEPVRFRLMSFTDSSLLFENPAHDFPQKISYTRTDGHSLMAEISGIVNGQLRSRRFPMRKARP